MLKSLFKKIKALRNTPLGKDIDHKVKSIVENTFKNALTEVIRVLARAAIAAAVVFFANIC